MSINVGGRDYSGHEINIIDGRPTLVVSMSDVLAPVVNGVEYEEFEYFVKDGVATLRVPMGAALAELKNSTPESFVDIDLRLDREASLSPLGAALATADAMGAGLDSILGELDARRGERPLARVVSIDLARGSKKVRTKGGRPRTRFTPRPIG